MRKIGSEEPLISSFDVVDNLIRVLVPTRINSKSGEHVEAPARRINGACTRKPTAVLRAGSLRATKLRANRRRQIRTYGTGGRL